MVVPIVRATVPSALGMTKNTCKGKSVIDISYDPESISGGVPKGERKGRQLRSAFSSQLMLLSLVCAVLRESGNKDSTITSAVKS